MPTLQTGNFTDQIIHAVWTVATNSTGAVGTGDGQSAWKAPAKCVFLAYDKSTGTAQFSACSDAAANTTGVDLQLRNTTDAVDLFGTKLQLRSEKYEDNAILISTQSSLVIDAGDWLCLDVDVANAQSGGLVAQAYFYGI